MDVEKILGEFNAIAKNNHWQGLHTPKNLAAAAAVEMGELVQHFQWLPDDPVLQRRMCQDKQNKIEAEIADVLMYVLALSQSLQIDLHQALENKIRRNKQKFISN